VSTRIRVVISRAEFYERPLSYPSSFPVCPFSPSVYPLHLHPYPFPHVMVPILTYISRMDTTTFHPATFAPPQIEFANDFGILRPCVVVDAASHEQPMPHRCIVIVPVVKTAGLSVGPTVRLLVRLIAITLERGDSPCSFFLRHARENVLHGEEPNEVQDVIECSL